MDNSNNVASERKFIVWIIPAGLAVAALVLRLWGIGWALPLKKAHIDESVVIFYTMHFFTGDLNPHIFFDYPTLQLYIYGFFYFVAFLAGKAAGMFASLDRFVGIYLNGDASFFYLIARSISAAFGTASVLLVYGIGRRYFRSGLLPAIMMAVIPVHVLHSHYATVDVGCIFFLLLSFLFLCGYYYDEHTSRNLFAASFVLGLAAAVKYYPFIFFLPLAAAVVIRERTLWPKKVPLAGALTIAGFVAGCPYSVLDFPAFAGRFIDRFRLIVWGAGTTPAAAHFDSAAVIGLLARGMTIPLFTTLALGIVLLLIPGGGKRKEYLLWLSFPLLYIAFLATWKIASPHYLMPAMPFLLLLGTAGFMQIRRIDRRVIYAGLLIVCLVPLFQSLRIDHLLTREDTRLVSYRWVKENLASGSRILRLPYTPEFRHEDPFAVRVDWEYHALNASPDALGASYDYIIYSSFSNRMSEWEKALQTRFRIIKEWPYVPLASFHHPRITIYGKKI